MTPAEFVRRWQLDTTSDGLVRLAPQRAIGSGIGANALHFLLEAGLPRSAAPGLSFADVARDCPSVEQVWDINDFPPGRFRVIGSDDTGDPICLDASSDDRVVRLMHDCGWSEQQPMLVNSGVAQLAACLLEYRDFVQTRGAADPWAHLDRRYPAEAVDELRDRLASLDHAVSFAGSFWDCELTHVTRRVARPEPRSRWAVTRRFLSRLFSAS